MGKSDNVCPLRLAMSKVQGTNWTDADVKAYISHKMQPIRASVALFEVLASADSLELTAETRAEVRRALASVWVACDNVKLALAKVPEPIRARIVSETSGKAGRKAAQGYGD